MPSSQPRDDDLLFLLVRGGQLLYENCALSLLFERHVSVSKFPIYRTIRSARMISPAHIFHCNSLFSKQKISFSFLDIHHVKFFFKFHLLSLRPQPICCRHLLSAIWHLHTSTLFPVFSRSSLVHDFTPHRRLLRSNWTGWKSSLPHSSSQLQAIKLHRPTHPTLHRPGPHIRKHL